MARRAIRHLVRTSAVTDPLARRFGDAGHRLYLVGGPVRDALLDRDSEDLDFTTDARPEQILELVKPLGATWTTGLEFGTVGVQVGDHRCEITTFRSDFEMRMHPDQIIKGITALKSARPGRVPDATQEMIDTLWPTESPPDVSPDVTFAALMLLRARNLGLAIGKHEAEVHRVAEENWQRPFAEIGLDPEEASIIMDCVLALHDHIARGAMAGTMTRDRAIDLYVRTVSALIKALADSSDRTAPSAGSRH